MDEYRKRMFLILIHILEKHSVYVVGEGRPLQDGGKVVVCSKRILLLCCMHQERFVSTKRSVCPHSGMVSSTDILLALRSYRRIGRWSARDCLAARAMTTGTRPSCPVTGTGLSWSTASTKASITATKLSV